MFLRMILPNPDRRDMTQGHFLSEIQLIRIKRFYSQVIVKLILKNPVYLSICPWGNGYRRRKWTRRHEFKSWTRLIAFHIALIPLGKV